MPIKAAPSHVRARSPTVPAGRSQCPGRQFDEVNRELPGSKPIVLEVGGLVDTTREVVSETRDAEVVALALSVERPAGGEINRTLLRLEMAAEYGIPLASITLSTTPGSRRHLMSSLRRRLDSILFYVTVWPHLASTDSANISTWFTNASLDALAARLSITAIALASTPVVTTSQITTARTVTLESQRICPRGHWCTAGLLVECARGYFNPHTGNDSQVACLRCPEHSSTNQTASISIDQCVCDGGFEEETRPDGKACVCSPGYGLLVQGASESCVRCE